MWSTAQFVFDEKSNIKLKIELYMSIIVVFSYDLYKARKCRSRNNAVPRRLRLGGIITIFAKERTTCWFDYKVDTIRRST